MIDHRAVPAYKGAPTGLTGRPVSSQPVNQMKNRMQALGLLDRAVKATTDDELVVAIAALDENKRDGLASFTAEVDPAAVRSAVKAGRIDGGMEAIAAIISDGCLADCIEALGDNADNPSTDELRDVLPGVAERHGVSITRIMLASTVVGEAPASAIIRDLLKSDELVALPTAEPTEIAPVVDHSGRSEDEQAALRAKRAEARKAKQEADRARREQSANARRRK
jgi:hypothetical protein